MNTYTARILQTSDGLWHFHVYRSIGLAVKNGPDVEVDSQTLMLYTVERLIEAIDLASTLQMHISNIAELPLTQYCRQVA